MKIFANLSKKQKKWVIFFGVAVILIFMFLIAIFSSSGDSGTVDEVAHIPSGYSYVKYQDYRLNPEHPPLAKALAGLPLAMKSGLNGLEDDWSWDGINQWEAGWHFLYEAGNNPAEIFFWARLPMIFLMLLLGLFIYKWSAELFGRKVGLITLILYAFYPDVIAHGRLVTTDIAAAFGYVAGVYFFDKALREKTLKYIIFAALAFGLAQLLKFSAFLLFGIFLLLIFIRAYLDKDQDSFLKQLWSNVKIYFWVSIFSVIVVWLVYIPFVWNTPSGIEHKLIETNLTSDPRTLTMRNLLHLLEGNPFSRAIGHYLLGIMLVFARVAGGNATFVLGHLSDKSISWFFPFAWAVKTPIAIILLYISSVIIAISKFKTKKNIGLLSLFFIPILVYWGFTLKGSLNIGIRHLIPTIPFALLVIAFGLNYLINQAKLKFSYYLIGILVLFEIVSTLSYYPSYIGYFNEIVPRGERYKYLVDSSLDWGQDLLRLKKYVDDNEIDDIKIDYFGGSVPSYYIPQSSGWHSSYGPTTGWLAVSATFYQSSKLYGPKENKWSYEWLDNIKPVAEIGGSILVFNISDQDLIDHPAVSSYPIKKIDYPNEINTRKVGL